MNAVTIIDYGVGNLLSVCRAFEHCGATVTVATEVNAIVSAERLVLPGVGAFAAGMAELQKHGFVEAIGRFATTERPFFGICLGMQMMLGESEEFGIHHGLVLIPGRVVALPRRTTDGMSEKVPHIGWSAIHPCRDSAWEGTALADLEPGRSVYFVHSYAAQPADESHAVAACQFNGEPIVAAVARGPLFGCQFHPEKSGAAGLTIVSRFLAL